VRFLLPKQESNVKGKEHLFKEAHAGCVYITIRETGSIRALAGAQGHMH
jgi:hypothetical protein